MLGFYIYAHKRLPDTDALAAAYVRSIHILSLLIDIGTKDPYARCD